MNLYKAISQNEYLAAFPVLRSASHLSHISIISRYNADIQSLAVKQLGLLGILNHTECEYKTTL